MEEINYLFIVGAAFVAIASPGPATLAIAETSMTHGRYVGLSLATGVLTGSLVWSALAAFGLATLLHNNVWVFDIMRRLGAFYLLYLAFNSLRSALDSTSISLEKSQATTASKSYFKGLLIHLTNPKAILFFAALYSIGVPVNSQPTELVSVILVVASVSASIFIGYAIFFSNTFARKIYLKSKVAFNCLFALFFGLASLNLLVSGIGK